MNLDSLIQQVIDQIHETDFSKSETDFTDQESII